MTTGCLQQCASGTTVSAHRSPAIATSVERGLLSFPGPTARGLPVVSPAGPLSAARLTEEAPDAGPHHSSCTDRWRCCCGEYAHPVATMVSDHKAGCPVHQAHVGSSS